MRVAGGMDARYPISSFAVDVNGWAFFKNTFATYIWSAFGAENTTLHKADETATCTV